MPNRKTFDERDKYDHSSRSVAHREKNDLKPAVNDDKRTHERADPDDASKPMRRKPNSP